MSLQIFLLAVVANVLVLCAHAYEVPVSTFLTAESTRVPSGADVNLSCDVDGFPEPAVRWTKNGVVLASRDRITFTDTQLTVHGATVDDSGLYGCHAANDYSSDYSIININVEAPAVDIPPNCEDNPYFNTCHVIVKAKFCYHVFYSRFCCKSCVAARQLNATQLAELQTSRYTGAWHGPRF